MGGLHASILCETIISCRLALIQCAGSRDANHLPYCSGICCLGSLKHAAYLREQYADAQVDIYYIDIRAHGKMEAFYNRVRADPQVHFIKSKPGPAHLGAGTIWSDSTL